MLSSRADLVSGGDAVVRVAGAKRVRLNGRDITKRFGRSGEALLTGLKLGRNVITAGRRAQITLTNHPNEGPLFSGPQIGPWRCQSTAVDAHCNQPVQYSFLYKSTDRNQTALRPYDPADPPGDVATTTTDQGVEVPFVVRLELGYQDRDEYRILTLFDPAQPWTRDAAQRQWNHKLFIPHGGGCGSSHGTATAPTADFSGTFPDNSALTDSYVTALGRGFAVMSTALDNLGHNCNPVLAAESLMMAKERVVERYGDIRYTIGSGCSGGSITQQTVANAYPRAIYDGLIITCAYPDILTALVQFSDYNLLRHYFESPRGLVMYSTLQWGLVEGRPDPLNAIAGDEVLFKPIVNPESDCSVPADQRYDSEKNPGGVRCGVIDYWVNLLGPRPPEVWSPNEKQIGRGFAGIPFGNEGIQYGLEVLEQGLITAGQFVELNDKVGGLDVDFQPVPQRSPGDDVAVANAYRSGLVNGAHNLSGVAIIHHAGPDPGYAHDYAHSTWIRDRLIRAQGHRDNHVLWYGPAPLIGDTAWPNEALVAMDDWLARVEADHSRRTRPQKIVADRPAGLADRCTADSCKGAAATDFDTPRNVAGADKYNDVLKCELKPLQRTDYSVTFTDEQWGTLQQTFPTGVCDWSRPGVGQQPAKPFLRYQTAGGKAVYGGAPLGRAPRSRQQP